MRKFFIILTIKLMLLLAMPAFGATTYYVDPTYTDTGSDADGSASDPWTVLDAGAWTDINTALASGEVTVYFSALQTDGSTQETYAGFVECARTDGSSNRLTLDGHGYYNTNDGHEQGSWSANPTAIGTAYTSNKVFEITGNGSSALGWTRSSTNKKQDYVTVRGFETTGASARTSFAGDYTIFEYLYIHDITGSGAALTILYTYPDACTDVGDRLMDACTDMAIRYVYMDTVYGEGIYVGGINPDCPVQVQCDMGNEHDTILIEEFYIANVGSVGGQGDAIDIKNGVTNLTIQNGEITSWGVTGGELGAIVLPQTFVDGDQGCLIDSVYIHDPHANAAQGKAIYGLSSTVSCDPANYKGYQGVNIRNCIIDTVNKGIEFGSTGDLENIYIHNNTVYNVTNVGITLTSLDGGTGEIINNLVFDCNSDGNQIVEDATVTSNNNAYYGTFSGTCTSCVDMTEAQKNAVVTNASGGDFSVATDSCVIDVGDDLSGTLTDDYAGVSRPKNSVFDIGAYEYPYNEPVSGGENAAGIVTVGSSTSGSGTMTLKPSTAGSGAVVLGSGS